MDEIQDITQKERELGAMINSALHRDVIAPLQTGEEIPLIDCTTNLSQLIEMAKKERQLLRFWRNLRFLLRSVLHRRLIVSIYYLLTLTSLWN